MNKTTFRFVYDGLFICLALILSYLESLLPISLGIPGLKIGLPNLAVIFVLYRAGWKDAFLVSLVRVLLVALLFGNFYSFCYSFGGAFLSLLLMTGLKKTGHFHLFSISVSGAVFHHVGQILFAILLLGTEQIIYYLPLLTVAGMGTGFIIGSVASLLVKRVPAFTKVENR